MSNQDRQSSLMLERVNHDKLSLYCELETEIVNEEEMKKQQEFENVVKKSPFPVDILLHVMQFMSPNFVLHVISRVSHYFRDISLQIIQNPEYWKQRCFELGIYDCPDNKWRKNYFREYRARLNTDVTVKCYKCKKWISRRSILQKMNPKHYDTTCSSPEDSSPQFNPAPSCKFHPGYLYCVSCQCKIANIDKFLYEMLYLGDNQLKRINVCSNSCPKQVQIKKLIRTLAQNLLYSSKTYIMQYSDFIKFHTVCAALCVSIFRELILGKYWKYSCCDFEHEPCTESQFHQFHQMTLKDLMFEVLIDKHHNVENVESMMKQISLQQQFLEWINLIPKECEANNQNLSTSKTNSTDGTSTEEKATTLGPIPVSVKLPTFTSISDPCKYIYHDKIISSLKKYYDEYLDKTQKN